MTDCETCKIHFKNYDEFKRHMEQHITLNKYQDTTLDNFEKIEGVPKVVYICWFGGYEQNIPYMCENRYAAFLSLIKHINIPICLITNNNYLSFVKEEYPLHPAFEYLSGVHKSDYFRCYMLQHYGGGYHDVKHRNSGWEDYWNDDNWLSNDSIWMFGRREKNKGAIGDRSIRTKFSKLATMGWIICKPNTPYTKELLSSINKILDDKMNGLKKFPGYESKGYYYDNPFNPAPENGYPLRWLEILGEIFHPLMLKYTEHIKFGLPDALKKRYK